MSTNTKSTQNLNIEEINLTESLLFILKKWYVFVILGILFITFAIYKILSTPPQFKTTGTILIRPEQKIPNIMEGLNMNFAADFFNVGTSTDDEMVIFKSKTILSQLVENLDLQTCSFYQKRLGGYHQLYKNEPIIVVFPENYKKNINHLLQIDIEKTKNSTWKIKFKHKSGYTVTKYKITTSNLMQPIETPWGSFGFIEDKTKIDPEYPNYKLRFITVPKKSRIDEYSELITLTLSNKKSNAIDINIESDNIAKNEAIINTIIDLYNQNNTEYNKQTHLKSLKVIEERLSVVKYELESINQKVEEYKVKNQLANIPTQAELIIKTSSAFEQEIIKIETNYALVAFIENHITNSDTLDLIPNTDIDNGTLVDLITEYNQHIIEYKRLTRSTNEDNPFVAQLKNQIQLTRENILQSIKNIKEGIDIYKQDYLKQNNKIKQQISSIPLIEREYIMLESERNIKQTIYLFLLQQYEAIQTQLLSQSNSNRIINYAYTPYIIISPRKYESIFIAIFMTILCGLIYVFTEQTLNTKIRDKKQISQLTKNNIIASLPKSKQDEIITLNSNNPLCQAYRSLRTQLIFNHKTILITNSNSEENNMSIALNIALSLTCINKKVAFIDTYNNHNYEIGTNILDNTYNQINYNISYKNNKYLDIYPINSTNTNLSDLIILDNFNNFIKDLQNKYDFIIINSTPIESDSFLVLNRLTDISLFICSKNITKEKHIKYLTNLENNNKLNNISIIMNGVSEKEIL